MVLPKAVKRETRLGHTKILMLNPKRSNRRVDIGAIRKRLIQQTIATGRVNPTNLTSRRILTQVVANMKDEIRLREAQFERESKVHKVDAKNAFEKNGGKLGTHKSYETVLTENQKYITRTKRIIQQIETALKKESKSS
jgi:hypothetical protein